MTEQLAAMPADVEELNSRIERAAARGQLLESTAKNVRSLLAGATIDLYFSSIKQLDDWEDCYGCGTRQCARGRTPGISLRRHERYEFL